MWTVNQELTTLPEHLSSHLVFSGVGRVDGYLVSCVVFCRPLLDLWSFSFDHYIVCPSLIYGFWLPLWYLLLLFLDDCLSFVFWPLCCLSFDLRILIAPVVSSTSTSRWLFVLCLLAIVLSVLLWFTDYDCPCGIF